MQNFKITLFVLFCSLLKFNLKAQAIHAPGREEGEGPWPQLIIRGVALINGTLAPPLSPVDLVVENNRIVAVKTVGNPGPAIDESKRPQLKEGGKELNAVGMYLMPGFVDTHVHIPNDC